MEEKAEKDKIKIIVDVLRYGKKPYKCGTEFTEEVLKTSKVSVIDFAMQQVAYDIKLHLSLIKTPKTTKVNIRKAKISIKYHE